MDPTAARLWAAYHGRRGVAGRNALVEHYLPWLDRRARCVAARLPPWVERDDLRAAGVLGLIESIARFDPSRGARFEDFARRRVEGAMLDALRREDPVARGRRRAQYREQALARALAERLGRAPTAEELEAAGAAAAPVPKTVSLCGAAGPEDEPLDRTLDDPRAPDPTLATRRRLLWDLLLASLAPRERKVLTDLYLGQRRMRDVARDLGLTDGAISQIHARALAALRTRFSPQRRHELGL